MEGPIHGGAYFRNFTVDCFFNYGERIWWCKKAGGGWLSLKDKILEVTTHTVADHANQFSVFSCPTFTIGLVRVPKTLTF